MKRGTFNDYPVETQEVCSGCGERITGTYQKIAGGVFHNDIKCWNQFCKKEKNYVESMPTMSYVTDSSAQGIWDTYEVQP